MLLDAQNGNKIFLRFKFFMTLKAVIEKIKIF